MAWDENIDYENAYLYEPMEVIPDIIEALIERCDAAFITRPFINNKGSLSIQLDAGAITSVTASFPADPGNVPSTGDIRLAFGTPPNNEVIPYTAVSGTGNSRTFTVSSTITNTYRTSSDVWLYTDYDYDQIITLENHYYATGIIDSKITQLIPLYANHTQATGTEFIGFANFPYWTEATMLTAIGDTARVSTPLYPTAEWVSQVYRIINKLLWVARAVGSDGQVIRYDPSQSLTKRVERKSTWAQVVAGWATAGWVTPPGASYIQSLGKYQSSFGFSGRRDSENILMFTSHTAAHAGDLYMYSQDFNVGTYDNEGFNLTENAFGRFMQNASGVIDTETFDPKPIFDAQGAPPEPQVTFYGQGAGTISGALSGAITSITVEFFEDPGTLNQTGEIYLENSSFDSETVNYTATSGTGTTRTFTVDVTLDYSYADGDYSYVNSIPSREPSGDVYIGWLIGGEGSTIEIPPVVVLRFDIANGFSYK